jgi:hypothetical protein
MRVNNETGMRRVGYVACMGEMRFGRIRHRWEYNIRMNLKEIQCFGGRVCTVMWPRKCRTYQNLQILLETFFDILNI